MGIEEEKLLADIKRQNLKSSKQELRNMYLDGLIKEHDEIVKKWFSGDSKPTIIGYSRAAYNHYLHVTEDVRKKIDIEVKFKERLSA